MEYSKDSINIKEIDEITMYKMIQALFDYDKRYSRNLVKLFVEKRTDEKELTVLKEIDNLLFEAQFDETKFVKVQNILKKLLKFLSCIFLFYIL